jgi:hypothetical protein
MIKITKEKLNDLYNIQNININEIANYFDCSVRTIYEYINKYEIESRGTFFNDFTNEEIGDLLILKPIRRESGKHIIWKVLCKRCDKEYEIQSHSINKLKNKCCNKCSRFLTRKSKYISGHMFQQLKASAKMRNIEFNLDIEYLTDLFDKQNQKCSLTGMNLVFAENAKLHQKGFTTASLDRIDNTKGYIKGNVWWVHKRINIMKRTDSVKDFIEWCDKVSNYNKVLDSELKSVYTNTTPNGGNSDVQ